LESIGVKQLVVVPAAAMAKNACKDEKAKFCNDAKAAGRGVNDCLKEPQRRAGPGGLKGTARRAERGQTGKEGKKGEKKNGEAKPAESKLAAEKPAETKPADTMKPADESKPSEQASPGGAETKP
jgi:hypothetical protein